MRRILVIFLILLYPLNVLALSVSVSMAQQDNPAAHASMAVSAGDAFQGNADPDIDPDEPPSVADLHDLVNQDSCLQLAGLAAAAVTPHDVVRYCHSVPPPIKPPRFA